MVKISALIITYNEINHIENVINNINFADEIIVMNKGTIAEQGKHSELIAKNGIYKKLVDMQSFE